MLKSLRLVNFRQFRELPIEPLNRINLIAGQNNTGKTSILEALYLLFNTSSGLTLASSAFRSSASYPDDYDAFWKWLAYQGNSENSTSISALPAEEKTRPYLLVRPPSPNNNGSNDQIRFVIAGSGIGETNFYVHKNGGSGNVETNWPKVYAFSTRPTQPHEDAEQFNQIAARRDGRRQLVDWLRKVEPRLQDLQYLKLGQQPLVYADVGFDNLIPTNQLGQGFIRLMRIFSVVLLAKSNIILIDEIENGLGYGAQVDLWKGLLSIIHEEDIQIFATTHSYECIRAAYEVFAQSDPFDFALHRLERTKEGDVRAVTYDKETLGESLEMNLEVR